MSELQETVKRNTTAIITALIVLLLVINYLIFIVPKNETKIDQYNKNALEEFGLQFNNTLKDYANVITWETLKRKLISNKIITNAKNSIQDDWYKKNIIIRSILIDSIENEKRDIDIVRKISFKFDTTDTLFQKLKCDIFYCLTDTISVKKTDLIDRLKGAIIFKDWMIRNVDTTDKKKEKVVLNNNIDLQEEDSIVRSLSRSGVYNFIFSNKRFYKKPFQVEGTDFRVILVGAVDQDEFEKKSRNIDVNTLSLCILLVILLFLCIPMLKPLISSAREKLAQFDLISSTTGIGIIAMVAGIFIFTDYKVNEYKDTLRGRLYQVYDTIQESLKKELDPYKTLLAEPDIYAKQPKDAVYIGADCIPQTCLLNNLQACILYNKEGDVVKYVYMKKQGEDPPLRKNNADREYFKALTNSHYENMLTGVYAKKDNKYKLVYTKKIGDSLTSCVFSKNFAKQIKLDGITGYMFFHKNGRVILHSDSTKSMNERMPMDPTIIKLFHGINDTCFEINYDGDLCMVYGKQLKSSISDVPLYLLTYTKLKFSNSLKIYTIVNGFFIGLAYALGIVLLGLCYSVFFYLGNVPVISSFHLSWLFPDNSREQEYKAICIAHYSLYILFGVMYFTLHEHLLYIAILSGINIAFFAFVLLNQRLFGEKLINSKWFQLLIACIVVLGYLVPCCLYYEDYPAFGLSMSLLGHGVYLYCLKKYPGKRKSYEKGIKNERVSFIRFFSNVIAYHYLLIPSIIVLGLFNNEIQKVNDYQYSVLEKQNSTAADREKQNSKSAGASEDPSRKFYDLIQFAQPPSESVLAQVKFDRYRRGPEGKPAYNENVKTLSKDEKPVTFFLIFCLIVVAISIKRFINFYAGRFFFFDLSEAYRKGQFATQNEFANCSVIIQPYDKDDLKELEINERPLRDRGQEWKLRQSTWLQDVEEEVISNEEKADFIMMDNSRTYNNDYMNLWSSLAEDEKFVMLDFAVDHFVNYKNKNKLVVLMGKGLIIADPLTGRLRVMNQGFRDFVSSQMKMNPEMIKAEKNSHGTFSQWRLPIIIVSFSALLLVMYLNKEGFNQILFVGGSVISAMGMIVKFLDSYKK